MHVMQCQTSLSVIEKTFFSGNATLGYYASVLCVKGVVHLLCTLVMFEVVSALGTSHESTADFSSLQGDFKSALIRCTNRVQPLKNKL